MIKKLYYQNGLKIHHMVLVLKLLLIKKVVILINIYQYILNIIFIKLYKYIIYYNIYAGVNK